MSFSELDSPAPIKQEYSYISCVLLGAPIGSQPVETLSAPISSHPTQGEGARAAEGPERGPHPPQTTYDKTETSQAQSQHCAAQHPQISLIMILSCAKGMSNLGTVPRKVNKNKSKIFLFAIIIKAIKASLWMVLIQSMIKCMLCNLELKLAFLRCRSLL